MGGWQHVALGALALQLASATAFADEFEHVPWYTKRVLRQRLGDPFAETAVGFVHDTLFAIANQWSVPTAGGPTTDSAEWISISSSWCFHSAGRPISETVRL